MRKFRRNRVTRKEFEMSVEYNLTPTEIDVRLVKPIARDMFAFWNELQHLIWLCGAEGRGEQPNGIRYIAEVVLNRWRLQYGYFGLTIREVIHKCSASGVYQFSAANPEDVNFHWIDNEPNSTFYKVAKAVIPVYHNQVPEVNPRMCYYHARNIPVPSFFKTKLQPCESVGGHIFYIDPNIPDSDIIR